MTPFDPAAIARESKWLADNPAFEQRPASIKEFLGKDYLDIEGKVRPGIEAALIAIFGEEVSGVQLASVARAMLTGAIGIGKTTFASIALPYMCHWVLCLKDPQDFFHLLPGSRIAFMQMSTSEGQAADVVFGDIFARIKHSRWFSDNYPYDDKYTKQIKFAKDIWILPGDSADTTFEGYNIMGGIIDEADSHKVTPNKDYASDGYDTIHGRIDSRFGNIKLPSGEKKNFGLLIVIGQMKKSNGFAASKYKELMEDENAHVVRMTIWDSLGWDQFLNDDGTRKSFYYDVRRKDILPKRAGALVTSDNIIEVPETYRKSFENNPEKALRDLAGIPPATNDPFISLVHKIDLGRDKWIERFGDESPVDDNPTRPAIRKWFRALNDPRKRCVHLDLAVSGLGDALGLAMGHVESVVEIEDEIKPYIIIDCLLRIKAMPGTEIMLSDVRRIIYDMKDDLKFRIKTVTMDGFQSTDTMQQLRKRRFQVDYLSVDRSTLPYEDLREAIYDERIEFPPYVTYVNKGDTKRVEIAVKELMELQHTGKKVDHPQGGSKDLADAMAGVVYTLMGDRSYRKGVVSVNGRYTSEQVSTQPAGMPGLDSTDPMSMYRGLRAPLPPNAGAGMLGLSIPARLQPRRESEQ